jgi:hypothetical protein
MEWWSVGIVSGGGELAEFYDSAEIEGVKDGSCEMNGRYYYV